MRNEPTMLSLLSTAEVSHKMSAGGSAPSACRRPNPVLNNPAARKRMRTDVAVKKRGRLSLAPP